MPAMSRSSGLIPRAIAGLLAACAVGAGASSASAAGTLDWRDCGDGFQCTTARVPRDYSAPGGPSISLAGIRLPARDTAHRIGSLFVNYGGPGVPGVDTTRLAAPIFDTLNERFDIVAFDPRGVGRSRPAVDCGPAAPGEDAGLPEGFLTPDNFEAAPVLAAATRYARRCAARSGAILPYVSTVNAARDLDRLRAAVGDRRLTYLGFSYGTYLGAVYTSLFPGHQRALVLDGPLDPVQYADRPFEAGFQQAAGFERAFGRFLAACADDVVPCGAFADSDPLAAFDDLVARADAQPLPAGEDGAPVDGDDILLAAQDSMYYAGFWPDLARALAAADGGDGAPIRRLVDVSLLGSTPHTPLGDQNLAIAAIDTRLPRTTAPYIATASLAWASSDHFWWVSGYEGVVGAVYPTSGRDVFPGPFRASGGAPPVLVVANRYDPATPYRTGARLAGALGDARLLTVRGDGHTMYRAGSSCTDTAVETYLLTLTAPPAGTVCVQENPFGAATEATTSSAAPGGTARLRSLAWRTGIRRVWR